MEPPKMARRRFFEMFSGSGVCNSNILNDTKIHFRIEMRRWCFDPKRTHRSSLMSFALQAAGQLIYISTFEYVS